MSVVTEHLRRRGIPFEVISHPRAVTSLAEALALGIHADEVLKTVVLDTGSRHVLAVVPASRRLDMRRVHVATGDTHARLASEEEVAADFPGVELGALPPLGSMFGGAPLLVDPEVMTHETVVVAAGTQTESVRARVEDLLAGEDVRVVQISRHPEEEEELEPTGA
jgi:prolyl-tRNA editing enzyme YbaK/EbsC (Cys-tRNA(Pro) deacylase)